MDPIDPRNRFSGEAQGYARFRPDYPDALLAWVIREAGLAPGAKIADVGCGTGIATRLFAAAGLDAVGIDPNEDMLAEARRAGGARYQGGEAAATGIPAASVSLVVVAQAFHWFDLEPALDEFARILAPGGRVAVLYNLRGEGLFMQEYDAILRRYSSSYSVTDRWQATLDALRAHPRVAEAREFQTAHSQRMDLEGLIGRAWSSSYVFRGVSDRAGFDAALAALFEAHAQGGVVDFPYRSVALLFRPLSGSPRTGQS